MKKILILSFSVIARDPRVMRQVKLLHERYDLHVAGYGPRPVGWTGTYYEVPMPKPYMLSRKLWVAFQMIFGFYERFYWREIHVKNALSILKNQVFDLVLANDMHALPLAFKLTSQEGVIYDAHEYSPLEFSENFKWRMTLGRLNSYFCDKYLSRLAGMTTVCQGISHAYLKNFGVSANVVHNSPALNNLKPKKMDVEKIRLVHHGVALESRCLELMIEMMKYLDSRFSLDFYLVANKVDYYNKLIKLASSQPGVRFLDPVKMEDLPAVINEYDLGIYLLKPHNFNSKYALPNKFFEFVQGRVGIAVGPSPEMASLVKRYKMGVVAESFEPKDLALSLSKLTHKEIFEFKEAANQAAFDLNYENAGAVMLGEIERCLNLNQG